MEGFRETGVWWVLLACMPLHKREQGVRKLLLRGSEVWRCVWARVSRVWERRPTTYSPDEVTRSGRTQLKLGQRRGVGCVNLRCRLQHRDCLARTSSLWNDSMQSMTLDERRTRDHVRTVAPQLSSPAIRDGSSAGARTRPRSSLFYDDCQTCDGWHSELFHSEGCCPHAMLHAQVGQLVTGWHTSRKPVISNARKLASPSKVHTHHVSRNQFSR